MGASCHGRLLTKVEGLDGRGDDDYAWLFGHRGGVHFGGGNGGGALRMRRWPWDGEKIEDFF